MRFKLLLALVIGSGLSAGANAGEEAHPRVEVIQLGEAQQSIEFVEGPPVDRPWLKEDVLNIDLSQAVKTTYGPQLSTQGAGTPNQAGLGIFVPISIGTNDVWFADLQLNWPFDDFSDRSSIVGTKVKSGSPSTSTRVGYRWLTSQRDWMLGINGGIDTRNLNPGEHEDADIDVSGSEKADFTQASLGFEAVNKDWRFDINTRVPYGDNKQRINSTHAAVALNEVRAKITRQVSKRVKSAIGYYYHWQPEKSQIDSSGVEFEITFEPCIGGVVLGSAISYDPFFETRITTFAKYRIGHIKAPKTLNELVRPKVKSPYTYPYRTELSPIIAMGSTPQFRDIRVADPEESGSGSGSSSESSSSSGSGSESSSSSVSQTQSKSSVSGSESIPGAIVSSASVAYGLANFTFIENEPSNGRSLSSPSSQGEVYTYTRTTSRYIKTSAGVSKLSKENIICPPQVIDCDGYKSNVYESLYVPQLASSTSKSFDFTEDYDNTPRPTHWRAGEEYAGEKQYYSGSRQVCSVDGKIIGLPNQFGMDKSCNWSSQ